MVRLRAVFPSCLGIVFLFWGVQGAHAASLALAWDPSPDTSVTGYIVSYGTKSQTYTAKVTAEKSTSLTLNGLAELTTYFIVVQSYNGQGAVGPASAEVSGQTGASAPSISCPSPVVSSFDGNPVPVSLLAVSSGGVLPVSIGCTPASGSLFKVGTTPFSCTASDAVKQTASCSSTVVVTAPTATLPPPPPPPAPLTPLTIACPSIQEVKESGNSGKAIVRFADPVVSGGRLPVSVSCSPRSGTQFAVGTTVVSCQATDAASQVAACTTSATVLGGGR